MIAANPLLAATSPTATPTPCIAISTPLGGTIVSGSVPIKTNDVCAGAWWEQLLVDGQYAGSFAPGQVIFSSTTFANGIHQLTVDSQSANPGSVLLGAASESLNVQNGTIPTPTPTATPTPCITISTPLGGTIVSGSVPIKTNDGCAGAWWEQLLVDGQYAGAFTPGQVIFSSTTFANGIHQLTVDSQSANPGSVLLGAASESLNVQNGTTSTATPTPSPTSTPTSCLSIFSPSPGATISGSSVPITTNDWCPGAWFEILAVDGTSVGTFSPGRIVLDTTPFSNASHMIAVTSYSKNPGSVLLATTSEKVNFLNDPNATPTATPTPTHYTMLIPKATLPGESSCAIAVNKIPIQEFATWNQNDSTGYNSNQPPPGGVPSYFYQYAPCCNELPNSDFANVDGAYGGTTDDIIRVYACKWGLEENYLRAVAWLESGWHQDCAAAHGGVGCPEGGDPNNPAGCSTGLPITPITPNGKFCALEGFGGLVYPDQYDTWSLMQNKVYYEWMTWPMMQQSTPFAVDFTGAQMRACMNGDNYNYFTMVNSASAADYQNAVNSAKSNPNGGSRVAGLNNLQYLGYGCVDTHFNGDWYNGQFDSYLEAFQEALDNNPWPGGNH